MSKKEETLRDLEELLMGYEMTNGQAKIIEALINLIKNQRKKFLDKKDNRQNKYAIAYIRTLFNLNELLGTETFNVKIGILRNLLMEYKIGNYTMGEIINQSERMILVAKELLGKCEHKSNLDKVNRFLIDIRKRYW